MRRLAFVGIAVLLWVVTPGKVSADPLVLYVNFCPGDITCPTGITEASLTFEEIVDGDPNNYTVTIKIVGDDTSPETIDELSFSISGYQTPDDYDTWGLNSFSYSEAPPTTTWTAYFDNVNAGLNSCGYAPLQTGQEVCLQSDSPVNGTPTDGTNVWVLTVDLEDDAGPLTESSSVNLRAQFLNEDGSNAGILSPTSVPEPSSLSLSMLGLGLLGIGGVLRRRAQSARF